MINNILFDLVKKLNPSAIQKVVAGFHEFFSRADYVEDPLNMTLHITHNDADALGCALAVNTLVTVENMKIVKNQEDCARSQVITIYAPEYCSEDVVIAACEFFYAVYGVNPKRLIVSDIFVSPEVMNQAINRLFGIRYRKNAFERNIFTITNVAVSTNWKHTDCIQFLYVDHHKTNPCVDKIAEEDEYKRYNFSDETDYLSGYYMTVSTAGNYKKWKDYITDKYFMLNDEDNMDLDPCSICTMKPETRISAAKLVMEAIWIALVDVYPSSLKNGENYIRIRSCLENLIDDISQWDTFEWRDHPEYNHGHEKDFAYSLYTMPMEKIITIMLDHYKNLFLNENIFFLWTIPVEIQEATRTGHMLHDKAVDKMSEEAFEFNFEDVLKEVYPDLEYESGTYTKAILVTFPEMGNASLIFNDVMQDWTGYMLVCISKKPSDATVSFRSNSDLDVSVIAKLLGGGGHPQASGCNDSVLADKLRTMVY